MAGRNKYLFELQRMFKLGVETGIRIGTQFEWDCMQLTLRDKEAVGKDTFGKGRLAKIFKVHKKTRAKYVEALINEKISDCLRVALDAALREIHGEHLVPFEERYPEIQEIDITKVKKSWTK